MKKDIFVKELIKNCVEQGFFEWYEILEAYKEIYIHNLDFGELLENET